MRITLDALAAADLYRVRRNGDELYFPRQVTFEVEEKEDGNLLTTVTQSEDGFRYRITGYESPGIIVAEKEEA